LRRNALTLLVVVLGVALAACRQDMHDAPRYEPLEASTFFPNGSGSRMLVTNTVARGQTERRPAPLRGRGRRPASRDVPDAGDR
jgi:hypothetical protein